MTWRYRFSVTSRLKRATVPALANLLKRGDTYFVRLMSRWADVGRAMGARGGIRREIVRTLQTTNFREAQRRREEGLRAAREMVDAALRRHRLKPLTDWTADLLGKAIERRGQMQAGRGRVNHLIPCDDGTAEAVMDSDLIAEVIETEAGEVERRQGPDVARRFQEIAFGQGMSIAEAGRQWITSIRGKVRETTWRGYEASIVRLGDYLAAYEGVPSLEGVSLSAVSRRIAGEAIAERRAERASETVSGTSLPGMAYGGGPSGGAMRS